MASPRIWKHKAKQVGAGMAALSLAACAMPESELELTQSGLTLVPASQSSPWPNGQVPWHIIVAGGATSSQLAVLKERIRRIPGERWGRRANVFLDDFGDVATEADVPNGHFGIYVDNDPNTSQYGRASAAGFSATGKTIVQLGMWDVSDWILTHEVGHALGFNHEFGGLENNPICGEWDKGTRLTPELDAARSAMSYRACWPDPEAPDPTDISSWDVVGVQNAYGRKPAGTLVSMNNQCLDVTTDQAVDGNQLQTFICHGGAAQRWSYGAGQRSFQSGLNGPSRTIDVQNGNAATGTPVQMYSQRTSGVMDGQRWKFKNTSIIGWGGKCFDVQNGVLSAGQAVNLVGCNGTPAQKFELIGLRNASRGQAIRAMNTNLCVEPENTWGRLRLTACGTSEGNWYFTSDGVLHYGSIFGQRVQAQGANPYSDNELNMVANNNSPDDNTLRRQQVFLRGNIVSDLGTCLSAHTSNFKNGDRAITWGCGNDPDVVWDYYYLFSP